MQWACEPARDAPGWPETTVLTPQNFVAVLQMVAHRMKGGRADVLEAELVGFKDETKGPTGEGLPPYQDVGLSSSL